MVPSQKGMKSLSQTFMFSVSYWWNGLPNPTRTAESLTMLKKQLKLTFALERLMLEALYC